MTEGALPNSVKYSFLQRCEAFRTENCFVRKLLTLPPPEALFHYTSAEGIRGIIETRTMWFSDIRFLNDSTEILHGLSTLEVGLSRIKHDPTSLFPVEFGPRLIEKLTNAYVACFCEEDDLLTQWRGYTNSGGGYSLGFTAASLFQITKSKEIVGGPVHYDIVKAVQGLEDELMAQIQALDEILGELKLEATQDLQLREYAKAMIWGSLTLLIRLSNTPRFLVKRSGDL